MLPRFGSAPVELLAGTPALNNDSQSTSTLDSPVSRSGFEAPRWSSAIEDRYGLELSQPWQQWFDEDSHQVGLGGEFCEAVHPELLLDEAPEVIWPGLMPPDFLPLVGNAMGDWLCGRVGPDNTITEVVHWYHGGGDCLPYGETLAEAIVYDSLAWRFPGRERRLAIPAPSDCLESDRMETARSNPLTASVRWALRHLPAPIADVFDEDFPQDSTGDRLLQYGIAEVAVRCDLALAALDNEVRRRITPQAAAMLDARWDQDIVRWMFDPSLAPSDELRRLADLWNLSLDQWQAQDWDSATEHCRRIAARRHDLAWVHDVLGWGAQRSGDVEAAIGHYGRGAMASLFTDQSVRFRTHFDNDRVCKFSVARLIELDAADRLDSGYVARLLVATSPVDIEMTGWRDRICQYWIDRADLTAGGTDAESAARRYDLIYRAGWDVGCDSISRYGMLLGELADCATRAGQFARAELAKTHRECLRSRYLIG